MKKRFVFIPLVLVLIIGICMMKCTRDSAVVDESQIVLNDVEAPEETEAPTQEPTEAPEITKKPTEEPEVTEAPKETEVPKATKAPVATPAPAVTDAPMVTDAPVVTAAPTAAPVTPAPVTAAPATPVPVTPAPVTAAPVTAAPTQAPTPVITVAPATPAPTEAPTLAPTPEPVVTEAPAHTHSWDGGVVTTAATCGADGVMTYTCGCGETRTEAIAKTNQHDNETQTIYTPSTCATQGTQGVKCRVCGVTDVVPLPKTDDHNYVVTIPGCGTGETKYNCSVCGVSKFIDEGLSCVDNNGDHFCDINGCWANCVDSNSDQICDMCGCGI